MGLWLPDIDYEYPALMSPRSQVRARRKTVNWAHPLADKLEIDLDFSEMVCLVTGQKITGGQTPVIGAHGAGHYSSGTANAFGGITGPVLSNNPFSLRVVCSGLLSWVNSSIVYIAPWDSHIIIGEDNNKQLYGTAGGSSSPAQTGYSDSEEVELFLTSDGTTARLSINGVEKTTVADARAVTTVASSIANSHPTNTTDLNYASVSLWSRQLSADEIAYLYNEKYAYRASL